MTEHRPPQSDNALAPFSDPQVTAKGEPRAHVSLSALETLWFNTGTLCNIECVNCYIESSPRNDRLVYLSCEEVVAYLDEIDGAELGTREIGFTGGEPFMNPQMPDILSETLARGFDVLLLTNAMQPMMRPRVQSALRDLIETYGAKLTFRVSLDHYTQALHDQERGPGAFSKACEGLRWLGKAGATLSLAGRTIWGEDEEKEREGYRAFILAHELDIDPDDPAALVLFPEMGKRESVPEITTACWSILDVDPGSLMCASSRMVVKQKGTAHPSVVACTLLPYDPRFDLGQTLREAQDPVALNHRYCAEFCVLGGGSCTG